MINEVLEKYKNCDFDKKVEIYNRITQELYDFLDLKHPGLNIQLINIDKVQGNSYNPNKVAVTEMKLLELSIKKDGFTMPIVVASEKKNENWVVVDGFHRLTICKENTEIKQSLQGYIPASILDKTLENRVAATVRHNIARGTHQVELSAKLVTFLKRNDWSNQKIGQELGMDPDEVLRLKQITGLAEAFKDEEFSKSWQIGFKRI
ncbi:ParB-like nuclease domain-containing protein [Myroides marinus]|uniref:IbrB-like domain-containing protein n=1 Tax=Myroides marinus TaxID=703342 RepID=UPI002574CBC0|nr:ParB/RepB/Spo0J family partition protein [Myroides marinus]MDM1405542.1 ParB-like nuclease domain-containing protein [Myroides marinus]